MISYINSILPNRVFQTLTSAYFKGKLEFSTKSNKILSDRTRLVVFHLISREMIKNELFLVSALRQNGFRGTHSSPAIIQLEKMQITILPALSDNYMYLVINWPIKFRINA